jgi:hypothetical protein
MFVQVQSIFQKSFDLFARISNISLNRDNYVELWNIGFSLGIKKSDRMKVENLQVIGYDTALRAIVGDCKYDFTIPLWLVHCAISQFGTHELRDTTRQDSFNTIAGRMMHRLAIAS